MPRLHPEQKRLSGQELQQLLRLLLATYDYDGLRRLLALALDKQLQQLTLATSLESVLFDVIERAERESWSRELVAAAGADRPQDAALAAFAQRFGVAAPLPIAPEVSGNALVAPADQRPAPMNQTPLDSLTPERKVNLQIDAVDPIPWLSQFTARLHQVCRIERAGAPLGTGFLVGPDLVLTNWHVVMEVIAGQLSPHFIRLRFDFQVQADGVTVTPGRVATLHPAEWLVAFSPDSDAPFAAVPATALDYALLRTAEAPGRDAVAGAAQGRRGWTPLPVGDPVLAPGAPLYILGHPLGAALKFAQDTAAVLAVNPLHTRVRYTTNTEGGSSGSPCFDQQWNLVALHHAGIPTATPGQGAQYNEGIPIATVRQAWEGKLGGGDLAAWQQAALRAVLFPDEGEVRTISAGRG